MPIRSLIAVFDDATPTLVLDNPTLDDFKKLRRQLRGHGHPPAAALAELIAETRPGETLMLPDGVIRSTALIPEPITIRGTGPGRTIIDCTGIEPTWLKAVLLPLKSGVVLEGMTLRGAAISDGDGANAAGIRLDPGIGITLREVEITGNQAGILTAGGDVLMDGCHVHGNSGGYSESRGGTHEAYFAGDGGNVELIECLFECGEESTHAVKSRAARTTIRGCALIGNRGSGSGGSVLDVPDGGKLEVYDTVIELTARGDDVNTVFLSYAVESTARGARTVLLSNVRLRDGSGTGGLIVSGSPDARLVITAGCTYKGPLPPLMEGWGKVTGRFAPA